MNYEDIYAASGIPKEKIYEYQKIVAKESFKGNFPILIDIPTAGGKTLSVLAPTLALGKTLIFNEPTISLTEDLEVRIERLLSKLSKKTRESFSYIIDTGERKEKVTFHPDSRWERTQTHTYDANIVLTTYDEFIYRVMGYGDWRWAYLYPLRIEKNCHVCFDECHSLDSVGFTLFCRIVELLKDKKIGTYVMSATMPPALKESLVSKLKMQLIDEKPIIETEIDKTLEKTLQYFPNLNITAESKEGYLSLREIVQSEDLNEKKVIAVFTYISDAFEFYRWCLNQLYENCFFYHGRLLRDAKRFRYRKLKSLDEQAKGYFLVTTHAIKEGCDLNADRMFIEITDPFSLIQLLGRVRRFASATRGKVIVFGNMETFNKKCEKSEFVNLIEYEKLLQSFLEERVVTDLDITKFKSQMKETPKMDPKLDARLSNIIKFVHRADITYVDAWLEGIPYTREAPPSVDIFFVQNTRRLNFPEEIEEEPLPQSYLRLKTSCDIFVAKERRDDISFIVMIYDNGLWKKLDPDKNLYPRLSRQSLYSRRVYLYLNKKHLISRGLVFPPKIFNFKKINTETSVRVDNVELGYYVAAKREN
ncbi:MAG: DEAD/DEAH box helicase [Candidatus Bathyarchaeia archaeon]